MLYREYGRTGKRVSAIGFGGMRFPTPVTDRSARESADLALYAHARGVNYFDTAPFYCDDRSEEIVGLAIRQMKPGSYFVATKSAKSDAAELRAELERSLERLGVPRIHFFHVWCVMNKDDWEARKRGGAVEAALRARDEGLVEHVVFSTHMRGNEIADVIAERLFEGVLLGYSAINFPYRRQGIEAAGRAGLGVVTMNPLGGGVIPRHAKRFDFIRRPGDPDVVTAALRFNLSHPAITTALVGFNNKAEVDHALAALDNFVPHDADYVAALEKQIEEKFTGLCTGCGYCLPCPADIPIPKYMDAYNMLLLDHRPDEVLMRLKWHWNIPAAGAGRCTSCGRCESECTQSLPIIERLAEISKLAP